MSEWEGSQPASLLVYFLLHCPRGDALLPAARPCVLMFSLGLQQSNWAQALNLLPPAVWLEKALLPLLPTPAVLGEGACPLLHLGQKVYHTTTDTCDLGWGVAWLYHSCGYSNCTHFWYMVSGFLKHY